MKKISIIIPVFNEKDTLDEIIQKVENTDFCGLEKEIIFVDDCSLDGSKEILRGYEDKHKVYYHGVNLGKGAAIRTALEHVEGDIVVIQDADLEYDPTDYQKLLPLILENKADVVYGSRFLENQATGSFMFTHYLGNKVLTLITNILFNVTLTDMETCYKAFRADFIKDIKIESDRFDFEPEITSKIIKKGARIKEVPISYYGRLHAEGKKITWKDGLHAVKALIKYRFD